MVLPSRLHLSRRLRPARLLQARLLQAMVALTVLVGAGVGPAPLWAASPLLESVKQNPELAKRLCSDLRQLNARGLTSTSPEAIAMVAQSQGLSSTDAEILATYVVGLHCPDVR